MATYAELLTIATSAGSDLHSRIKVAVIVACDVIRTEPGATANHANRLKWAAATLQSPDEAARLMLWAVLAQNRAATAAQITGADDATVQTAVNAAVDLLAQG
ncbi:MAG TPA: hypothetical protein PKE15_00135 [Ottowia sp.]|nr:hypothetical protein [Ottowia sp.]